MGVLSLALLLSGCGDIGMRPIKIRLSDGKTQITTDDIPTGKQILLVNLVPDCEDCEKEAEMIIRNIDSFKAVRVYFISTQGYDEMLAFERKYNLSNYPNIKIGRDVTFQRGGINVNHMPGSVLYDANKKFKKGFDAFVSLDEMMNYINSKNSET